MKKSLYGMLAVLLLAGICAAQAQYAGGKGKSNYDPKTETTVTGLVEEVQTLPGKGANTGTHLMLKTEKGMLDVHVGPTAYLSSKGFTFAKGDTVEVLGSKVTLDGKDAVIAREVKSSGKTLTLRNAAGKPMWSGGPRN
jgi:DNA/RNA endonuclease YhcR with UshA esterase domain